MFADANVADDATVTSDGHAGYNATSLGDRSHDRQVESNAEQAEHDTLQRAHSAVSMLKRWLIGPHAGEVKPRHLQTYLDEFAFRWNRRSTIGVGRISARTIEMLVSKPKRTMRDIVEGAQRYPLFQPVKQELPEREGYVYHSLQTTRHFPAAEVRKHNSDRKRLQPRTRSLPNGKFDRLFTEAQRTQLQPLWLRADRAVRISLTSCCNAKPGCVDHTSLDGNLHSARRSRGWADSVGRGPACQRRGRPPIGHLAMHNCCYTAKRQRVRLALQWRRRQLWARVAR